MKRVKICLTSWSVFSGDFNTSSFVHNSNAQQLVDGYTLCHFGIVVGPRQRVGKGENKRGQLGNADLPMWT